MSKKPTIRDVAQAMGISPSTVSRALAGQPGVSAKKQQEILGVCRKMGYFLSRNEQDGFTFGVIVGNTTSPFNAKIISGLQHDADRHGHQLLFLYSRNDLARERTAFEFLLHSKVDGVILIPANLQSAEHLGEMTERLPTVFLNEELPDRGKNYVCVDNLLGGRMGTEYLISLGHRNILYFGWRKGNPSQQLRYEGYVQACCEHGLEPMDIAMAKNAGSSIQTGYQLGKIWLDQGRSPEITAVFAAADALALGLLSALEEQGVRVPDDISLLGFDGIESTELHRIRLSTVNQPVEKMAQAAIGLLLEQLRHSQIGFSHHIFQPTLIIRDTCTSIC